MYSLANSFVGSAAAEIAVHGLRDLFIRWVGRFRQERRGGHDLSCLTVAALRDFLRDPGLLQDVQPVGSQPFNRCDALARDLRHWRGTRTNRIAIDVDGAGAAQSRAASEFGSGKFESVAKNPEERRLRRDADSLFTAVDAECDVCHVGPVVKFWEPHNMVTNSPKKWKWRIRRNRRRRERRVPGE